MYLLANLSEKIMTEIRLYKFNIEIKTTNIFIVKELKKLGWKIKYSNLGELL